MRLLFTVILVLLFTMDSFSQLTRLTNSNNGAGHAEWSPDGTMIACCTWEGDISNIWIIPTDGSEPWKVDLQPVIGGDFYLSWSQDSRELLFDARDSNGPLSVFRVNINSGEYSKISPQGCFSPTWSPDGSKFAYSAGGDIWTRDISGLDPQKITSNDSDEWHPDWHPDGDKILFTSNRDGNAEIYVISVSTKEVERITNNSFSDDRGCWSRDGNKIVFVSKRTGDNQVFVMNSDGSDQFQVTTELEETSMPTWSPDGKQIAFSSWENGGFYIYSIDVITNIVSDELDIDRFELSQNYPNPFNPTTEISFQLTVHCHVELSVFDMLGKHIQTLFSDNKSAGEYTIEFDASNLSSGTYIYQLRAGDKIIAKKMSLMK